MLSSSKKQYTSPYENSSSKKKKMYDRFIPHTVAKNLFECFVNHQNDSKEKLIKNDTDKMDKYQSLLDQELLSKENNWKAGKMLRFGDDQHLDKENQSDNACRKNNAIHYANQMEDQNIIKKRSKLPKEPYKILDAPLLKDDFYLNLLDWSDCKNIAVGLQSSLYVWSGCTSRVTKIYEAPNCADYICSVGFMRNSPKLCIGTTEGKVKVFDISKARQSIEFQGVHFGRIGSLGCTNSLICTGSRDGYVSISDIRTEQSVFRYKAHNQEICGLKVSPSGDMIATGGNDNKLVLFSLKKMENMMTWGDHKAAVKAIGFNPNDPSIASGGGTADRRIRVFSLQTFEMLNEIDTGSQICNLMYSSISNELVTSHGYSLNQINLWKWGQNGSLQKIDSLMGHKNRVLYLAGESQGAKIVTGAGDEELRLWKVFDQNTSSCGYDLR